MLPAQPIVQGTEVDRGGGFANVGQWVMGENPVINGGRTSVEPEGLVLAPVCTALPTQVVADSPFADAEGLPDLGVALPHELEGTDLVAECHGRLRLTLYGCIALSHDFSDKIVFSS
jgi:hypothetical protein